MSVPERLAAAIGDRYRVERELGAGGMATVYLAQDLRHDRRVAVKVLRPELAAVIGAERFLSEIKTTANLQHPHILPLHDSGSIDGILFYVMPYVEGESLRERIMRERQLPIAEAVRLATEVANALDYAHRQGVVHRDIKPENILLHDGGALVADFGIALAVSTAGTRMTETGMSLGTPHYMSPEQAMGEREITPRSDVYALGCVTYEMLAGEPPFTGPTAQAIVARVMTEEPRGLTLQRKSVPPHVEAAVQIALSKIPADRYATAADFALALNDPSRTMTIAAATPMMRRHRWRDAAVVGGLALLVGAGLTAVVGRPAVPAAETVRVLVSLPDSGGVVSLDNLSLAISPDGKRLVYVGPAGNGRMLWMREMSEFEGKPLPGTEGAQAPFFSPDGQHIGFFGIGGGRSSLKTTPAGGGLVRTLITDSAAPWGGAWGKDGNIYFPVAGAVTGLGRVPAEGGAITIVSRADSSKGEEEHDFPALLPSGKGAIVQVWKGSPGQNEIGVVSFETGRATSLVKGTYARFLPPNRLLFGTVDGRVFVVPFDEKRLALAGDPVQVLDQVQGDPRNGSLQFDVSRSGTLVYIPGAAAYRELVWVERDGATTSIDSAWVEAFGHVALSPDGTRVALTIGGLIDAPDVYRQQQPPRLDARRVECGLSGQQGWPATRVAAQGRRKQRRATGREQSPPTRRSAPVARRQVAAHAFARWRRQFTQAPRHGSWRGYRATAADPHGIRQHGPGALPRWQVARIRLERVKAARGVCAPLPGSRLGALDDFGERRHGAALVAQWTRAVLPHPAQRADGRTGGAGCDVPDGNTGDAVLHLTILRRRVSSPVRHQCGRSPVPHGAWLEQERPGARRRYQLGRGTRAVARAAIAGSQQDAAPHCRCGGDGFHCEITPDPTRRPRSPLPRET
jgi:eukaryotic-like serine/threonine-protein kinase